MGSLSLSEILTILVIMLIIFGPRRLPEMARKAGEWAGKASRAARELQDAFREEYREEAKVLDDLRHDVRDLRRDLDQARGTGGTASPAAPAPGPADDGPVAPGGDDGEPDGEGDGR